MGGVKEAGGLARWVDRLQVLGGAGVRCQARVGMSRARKERGELVCGWRGGRGGWVSNLGGVSGQ